MGSRASPCYDFEWWGRSQSQSPDARLPLPLSPPHSHPTHAQAEGGERARGADPSDPQRLTFADCLGEVGEYTALIELVFGHEDHFGVKAGQLIENKMLLPRGAPQPDLLLSGLGELGPCPQGGLAIPRGKIATVIGAMQDVELHELHGVMHMGRTPTFEATHGRVAQGGGR